jgi:hypothetical protein
LKNKIFYNYFNMLLLTQSRLSAASETTNPAATFGVGLTVGSGRMAGKGIRLYGRWGAWPGSPGEAEEGFGGWGLKAVGSHGRSALARRTA